MSKEDFEDFGDLDNPELSNAAKMGDVSQVKELLEQWKSELSPAPLTALHLNSTFVEAVSYHHPSIASYLHDEGAEVSDNILVLALGVLGETDKAIAMFQTFLDHGWNINSKTGLGVPVLKHVVDDETLTRWFLEHGADPNSFGKSGSNILDVAAANSTSAVFDLLLKYGANLGYSDALHSAAGELQNKPGRVEMMTHLLDMGMDINVLWRREYPAGRRMGRGTPLHAATSSQQSDRIQLLIERGADPEAKNTLDQTPLQYAIAKNLTASVEVLKRYSPHGQA